LLAGGDSLDRLLQDFSRGSSHVAVQISAARYYDKVVRQARITIADMQLCYPELRAARDVLLAATAVMHSASEEIVSDFENAGRRHEIHIAYVSCSLIYECWPCDNMVLTASIGLQRSRAAR